MTFWVKIPPRHVDIGQIARFEASDLPSSHKCMEGLAVEVAYVRSSISFAAVTCRLRVFNRSAYFVVNPRWGKWVTVRRDSIKPQVLKWLEKTNNLIEVRE